MSGAIWRLTNNGTQGSGNSSGIGDLPANQIIDIPASICSPRWGANGPGSSLDRIYIQNQTIGIVATGAAGTVGNVGIGTTGADNVARAQLIEDAGFGIVLYDESAS